MIRLLLPAEGTARLTELDLEPDEEEEDAAANDMRFWYSV